MSPALRVGGSDVTSVRFTHTLIGIKFVDAVTILMLVIIHSLSAMKRFCGVVTSGSMTLLLNITFPQLSSILIWIGISLRRYARSRFFWTKTAFNAGHPPVSNAANNRLVMSKF